MAQHNDEDIDRRLRGIAACLGIPVEEFFADPPATELGSTAECLRLWHRLRTDEGRRRALAGLRRAVDDESA